MPDNNPVSPAMAMALIAGLAGASALLMGAIFSLAKLAFYFMEG